MVDRTFFLGVLFFFAGLNYLLAGDGCSIAVASPQQTAREQEVIRVWPGGLPEDAKPVAQERIDAAQKKTTIERIFYVETPTLTVFRPNEDRPSDAAVIVCPGGGYHMLAYQHEGTEIAK
jgi:acetyl esterase/lipase